MLAETRLALRIASTKYDAELAQLIQSAVRDLGIAGITVTGVSLDVSWSGGEASVTDASTLSDPALTRAIITYVRCHFGSPEDYDRLKAAYDEQKAQLITSSQYGLRYAGGEEW